MIRVAVLVAFLDIFCHFIEEDNNKTSIVYKHGLSD